MRGAAGEAVSEMEKREAKHAEGKSEQLEEGARRGE
jgi:hypothetical protein